MVLNFKLNDQGLISDIHVAQRAGHGFDEAALKALQAYKLPIKDSAGPHSVAIVFCVAENKYRPPVNENINTGGYIGEMAVCDVKSPFINGTARYTPPATAPGGAAVSSH